MACKKFQVGIAESHHIMAKVESAMKQLTIKEYIENLIEADVAYRMENVNE